MAKGGDAQNRRVDNGEIGCDPDVKIRTMEKQGKSVPKLSKITNRKTSYGNLYRQERDLSPDFYDSVKIAND